MGILKGIIDRFRAMGKSEKAFIGGIEFARDWNLDIPPDDLRLYERLIQERTKKENEQSHIDG